VIVDSSALIAILRKEPEWRDYIEIVASAPVVRVSSANYFETAILIDSNRDPVFSRQFDLLVREAGILVEPVTAEQAQIAREAYRDFGRGSGHRARLNFGDCFAYALAKAMNEPLLFKGDDFRHTDVTPALS
jgi:ribonuclease VapC